MREQRFFILFVAVLFGCLALAACGGDDDDSDDDDTGFDDDTGDDDSGDDDDTGDDDSGDDDSEGPWDPTELGPYEVGNRSYVFVDDTRWDPATNGDRTILTEVWYPAADEAAELPRDVLRNFFGQWDEEVLERLAQEGATPEELANFDRETGSARDAPLHPVDGPFPIILFSHGLGGIRFQSYTLSEYIASHGFYVVAPDHTGSCLAAALPDGVVEFREDLVPISFDQRKHDLSFLIDVFAGLNAFDPDGFFTGRIDIEQVGTLGHSFGGTCAVEVAKDDNRVRAAVNMASFMFPWLPEGFDASTMFMIALEDDSMGDMIFFMRWGYDMAVPPKFKLEFFDSGHFTFTDVCDLIPSLMGDGDGCGMGERRATGEPFEFVGHDEAFAVIDSYVTAFFGYNLRSETHMLEFLLENRFPDRIEYDLELP